MPSLPIGCVYQDNNNEHVLRLFDSDPKAIPIAVPQKQGEGPIVEEGGTRAFNDDPLKVAFSASDSPPLVSFLHFMCYGR